MFRYMFIKSAGELNNLWVDLHGRYLGDNDF